MHRPRNTQANDAPPFFHTTLYVVGAGPLALTKACTTHLVAVRISWERVRNVSADHTCGVQRLTAASDYAFKMARGSLGILIPPTASLSAR